MKSFSRYGPPLTRSARPCSRIGTTHSRNVPSSARLDLVVAKAGIDQDFLAADLQQPTMNGEPDLPGLGLIVVGCQPRLVFSHMGVGEFRKDIAERIARKISFLDPRDSR